MKKREFFGAKEKLEDDTRRKLREIERKVMIAPRDDDMLKKITNPRCDVW